MNRYRRDFFRKAVASVGLLTGAPALSEAQHEPMTSHGNTQGAQLHHGHGPATERPHAPATQTPPLSDSVLPVQSPDVPTLGWTMDGGVKVFHLVAEPVKRKIHPMKTLDLWGYNGTSPGPTIQVNQGDRVRLVVDNHLPEATSMHWHGFEIPAAMDGTPGIDQPAIPPGGRFVYEFTLHQAGTYFYHSHMAMQEMMGMLGTFIMHPRTPDRPRITKDFVIMLQEYAVLPNNSVPNSMNMEFNWLTLNGKAAPAATPLIVQQGERVRIRLINLGMDHHPIHLHGNTFYVTGTEAGRAPRSTWRPENTVLVGVAQARDIEFDATNPGDWMLHCHLPHHMMNQMSSNVGPMTQLGHGMPAGLSMNTAMGMLAGATGAPLSKEYGPGLGRGLGVGSTNEQTVRNGQMSGAHGVPHVTPHPAANHGGMQMNASSMHAEVSPNANSVPGFPQDAYMESPMMAMDKAVWRPENYGLPPGWSGYMQGMMTLVRVLPPDRYEKVVALMRENEKQPIPYTDFAWSIPGAKAPATRRIK